MQWGAQGSREPGRPKLWPFWFICFNSFSFFFVVVFLIITLLKMTMYILFIPTWTINRAIVKYTGKFCKLLYFCKNSVSVSLRCVLHFFSVGFLGLIIYAPSVSSTLKPLGWGWGWALWRQHCTKRCFLIPLQASHRRSAPVPRLSVTSEKWGKQNFHYETMALLHIEYTILFPKASECDLFEVGFLQI